MRVPKRKQRALMLRLFKWTTPKDWYYDGHVWKMTPEAAEQALRKREAAKARYERVFKKEMSIAESGGRRNPSDYSQGYEHIHVHMRGGKRIPAKSHGGYGSAYAQGTAAGNMKRPRIAPIHSTRKEQEEWLSGYDASWEQTKNKRNPVPASAPSRALLCIGQLRDLELYDPRSDRTSHIKPKGKWLAWDGKQFQICNVRGQVNASLPSSVVAKHKKFHAANPQGRPFLASMPDRGPTVRDVGLLKSLVYYVPSKIRSPGKNKYLWHHAFGDTGHKGGDSYPIRVMPMLQRDSAGNLFIKRRAGNIFRVDTWLRG